MSNIGVGRVTQRGPPTRWRKEFSRYPVCGIGVGAGRAIRAPHLFDPAGDSTR